MSDIAAPMPEQASPKPNLDTNVAPITAIIFILLLAVGLAFTVYGVYTDVSETGIPVTTYIPFLLLGAALLMRFFRSGGASMLKMMGGSPDGHGDHAHAGPGHQVRVGADPVPGVPEP